MEYLNIHHHHKVLKWTIRYINTLRTSSTIHRTHRILQKNPMLRRSDGAARAVGGWLALHPARGAAGIPASTGSLFKDMEDWWRLDVWILEVWIGKKGGCILVQYEKHPIYTSILIGSILIMNDYGGKCFEILQHGDIVHGISPISRIGSFFIELTPGDIWHYLAVDLRMGEF